MILNRGPIVVIEREQRYFDYSACEYPTGLIQDKILYFNEENIDEVILKDIVMIRKRGLKRFIKTG
ncbi:DUF4176 domain-containing protein [Listeria booriae]|uniref:DUF4176 domain-containing protein n=1 Tax=Listeria booriae TaxID=1552123 RepID=UPI0035E3C810